MTRKHLRLALVVVTVVAVTATPIVAASDHSTLWVDDATVTAGETTTVEVTLSAVPDGLSGFNVTVALSNPDTATITDATVDGFALNRTSISDDGSAVLLKGVDAAERHQSGDGSVHLATVTVRGTDTADTDLSVDIDQVDDDDGERIDPATEAGSLTVEPADSGGDSDDDSGSSESDDGDASDSRDDGDVGSATPETGSDDAQTPSGTSEEGESEDGEQSTSEGETPTDEAPPTETETTPSTDRASATATETPGDDGDSGGAGSGETTSGSAPGFGAPVAAVALVAVSLLARRR